MWNFCQVAQCFVLVSDRFLNSFGFELDLSLKSRRHQFFLSEFEDVIFFSEARRLEKRSGKAMEIIRDVISAEQDKVKYYVRVKWGSIANSKH